MIFRKRNIVKGNFPRKQEFLQGVQDCMDLAWNEFPEFRLTYADLDVVFFPKGDCAGRARWKKIGGVRYFNLEFNVAAIDLYWEDTYLDTIPHEVAHIVTRFIHGSKVSSHGPEWKRIAKRLGCNGKRCHSLNLPKAKRPARRQSKELYISDGGTECLLGPTQHRRLQNTEYDWFRIKKTGEELFPHNHVGEA